jgi:hypothetical protein
VPNQHWAGKNKKGDSS